MAENKNGDVEQKIDDIAKELKELLIQRDSENSAPAADKKPAAKPAAKKSSAAKTPAKSTSKSTAAKPSAAKKPAAKKPAAKKPAAKKPVAKAVPAEEAKVEEPIVATTEEPTVEEPVVAPVEEAKVEEPVAVAEEPAKEPVEEAKAEEPAEEAKVEEPVAVAEEPKTEEQAEAPAEEVKAEEPEAEHSEEPKAEVAAATASEVKTEQKPQKSSGGFTAKTDSVLKKGKAPIFWIVNGLFIVSAILLMFASYCDKPNGTLNIFQYFANADSVKLFLYGQARDWANGGYVFMGILMFLCMFVPLVLAVKNIVTFVRKKDLSVHNADAIIYFATMLGLVAFANLYGAWISWGQVLCLIVSAIIFVFTVFTLVFTKSVKALPWFSIGNILLTFIALILVTHAAYTGIDSSWSIAAAIGDVNIGLVGFAFLLMMIIIAALLINIIMQIKRLPGRFGSLIEAIIPLAAGVCALITLIIVGSSVPDNEYGVLFDIGISGGFVFGCILIMIIAVADALLAFLKPLKKYRVTIDEGKIGGVVVYTGKQPEAAKSEQTPAAETAAADGDAASENAVEEEPQTIVCPVCKTENSADSSFCYKCGKTLK